MATRDRWPSAIAALERLAALPERPRVVVVDDGSRERAPAAARRLAEVVRLAPSAGAAARNAGVERLDTPYVAFCDDDSWWAPGALAAVARCLAAEPRLGALVGRVLVGTEERLCPVSAAVEAAGGALHGRLARSLAGRREAVLACGGVPPPLRR